MPVHVNKDSSSFRPRSHPVEIVVSANDESLGTVQVTLCELPSGLLEELEGEASELGEEIRECNKAISTARRRTFAIEDLLTRRGQSEGGEAVVWNPADLRTEAAELAARVAEMKQRRGVARKSQHGVKMQLIQWAICNHLASDFLNEEGEAVAFQAIAGSYDSLSYRIASPEIMAAYASVGRDFIDALYLAATHYQRKVINLPVEIWAETKRAKERLEANIKAFLDKQVDKAAREVTGDTTPEDRAAELGAEDDADPKTKGSSKSQTMAPSSPDLPIQAS